MTGPQIKYLLDLIRLKPAEAMADWRNHFTIMKNKHWLALLPLEKDPGHAQWLKANKLLSKHYRIDARSAETLHMLRLCRLPVVRHPAQATVFKYQGPGCGLCRDYPHKDFLHRHIFVDCPAVDSMCRLVDVPRPGKMEDWVLTEAQYGFMHSIRDLAHAIWRFERTMRAKGLVGTDPEVQHDHRYLFQRVVFAYQSDRQRLAGE